MIDADKALISGAARRARGKDVAHLIGFAAADALPVVGARTYTTSYQYNQASQLTQLTYPSTRAVAVGRDSIGRMTELTGYMGNVNYNVAGQVTGLTLGNGVTETYGYDLPRSQMISQSATKGGNTLLNLMYNYQAQPGQNGTLTTAGNVGQLMTITGAVNGTTESATYTYDLQGRLATSDQTSNSVTARRRFAYDRWENRTGMWDAVTGGTQIQSISLLQSSGAPTNRIGSVMNQSTTANYTYDAAGNVISDGAHSYIYDSENRVVSVDGGATALYSYDHQSRRWKKVAGSVTTHYVWQGSQILAEHNGSSGAMLVDYIYSGSRMIAKVEAGATRYFLSDRLSTRLVLDTTGGVVGRQAHLPYGEDFAESGIQQKHHFTSYERDNESALDYAINRSHSAGVGRFQQADPYRASGYMTDPQSWNRYSYTRNNPVNRVDPMGLEDNVITLYGWGYFDRYGGGGGGGGGDELLREEIVVVDRGVPITGDPAIEDLTDILIEGLGNLRGQCVSDLGTRAAIDGRIAELRRERGEIHFESWDSSNPINNGPNVGRIFTHIQTVNEYWRDRNEQDHVSESMQPAGRTVAYNRTNDEGGIDAQKYHTIILGPAYFNPGLDAKGLQLAGGNIERYRQTILVHEYLHLLNDLDDRGLFNHFHLGERGYGGLEPTNAITEWLLSNCANR